MTKEQEEMLEEILKKLQPPNPSIRKRRENPIPQPRAKPSKMPPPPPPSRPSGSNESGKGGSGGNYEIESHKMPNLWFPNSKVTIRRNGRRIQKRWYNSKGEPKYDRDYDDHGNPKRHEVPHDHGWNNGKRFDTPTDPWKS